MKEKTNDWAGTVGALGCLVVNLPIEEKVLDMCLT